MAGLPPAAPPPEAADRAVVVFSGATDMAWLRLLRRGFRHCFAVVRGGPAGQPGARQWVVIDPLAHALHIEAVPVALVGDAAAIAAQYRGRGLEALAVHRSVTHRDGKTGRRVGGVPIRPLTCVEVVKNLIGCQVPGIFTPWQLYRFLSVQNSLETAPALRNKILDSRQQQEYT